MDNAGNTAEQGFGLQENLLRAVTLEVDREHVVLLAHNEPARFVSPRRTRDLLVIRSGSPCGPSFFDASLAVEIDEAVQARPAAASRLRIRSRLANISSWAFLTCSPTSSPCRLTTSPPTITVSTSAGPAPKTIVAMLSP